MAKAKPRSNKTNPRRGKSSAAFRSEFYANRDAVRVGGGLEERPAARPARPRPAPKKDVFAKNMASTILLGVLVLCGIGVITVLRDVSTDWFGVIWESGRNLIR